MEKNAVTETCLRAGTGNGVIYFQIARLTGRAI
jgi:hypothetical protein